MPRAYSGDLHGFRHQPDYSDHDHSPAPTLSSSTNVGRGFIYTHFADSNRRGRAATTTIYVRFTRASSGTSSGNITHTSGATPVNLAVSGTASLCSVIQLTAADRYLCQRGQCDL